MNKAPTEIERLDLAARAAAVEPLLSKATFPLLFLTIFLLIFAPQSEDSPVEILMLWTMLLTAAVTVIMLWRHWCYALYGLSILNFLGALHILASSNDNFSHTILGSAHDKFFLIWFLTAALTWGRTAAPFIAAQSEQLEMERNQVGQWLSELIDVGHSNSVLEFTVQSFWNGHWTYRLLKLENCWAVAKFKYHNLERLSDYRVLTLDAVKVAAQANGQLKIEIANQVVGNVSAAPDLRDRLLSSAKAISN